MKKWLSPLLLCLALGLAAAGCGSSDKKSSSSEKTKTTKQQPADTGGTAGGAVVKVSMKNIQFMPKDVTVKKGGTIEWTNDDQVAHTVTKDKGPGASFDSGNVDQGGTFKQKLTVAGKIDYVCRIHANQTGTITVQ